MTQEVFERMVDEVKLAQHKQDRWEFEEWWEKDEWSNPFGTAPPYEPCLRAWLESRRLLRGDKDG